MKHCPLMVYWVFPKINQGLLHDYTITTNNNDNMAYLCNRTYTIKIFFHTDILQIPRSWQQFIDCLINHIIWMAHISSPNAPGDEAVLLLGIENTGARSEYLAMDSNRNRRELHNSTSGLSAHHNKKPLCRKRGFFLCFNNRHLSAPLPPIPPQHPGQRKIPLLFS